SEEDFWEFREFGQVCSVPPDLSPEERRELESIRRRKQELLGEIQRLRDELSEAIKFLGIFGFFSFFFFFIFQEIWGGFFVNFGGIFGENLGNLGGILGKFWEFEEFWGNFGDLWVF
uniref:Uncharacterized protein n=1 Tax=Serinus canaria TaxID=9135 RepID=A0A8C9MYQ7_SERCA